MGVGDLNHWKIFETNIVNHSLAMGLDVLKIPEGVRLVYDKSRKLIPVRFKTCFDFVVSFSGVSAYFDAKCMSSGSRLNYKNHVSGADKIHQWAALQTAWDKGVVAGYLIWFPKDSLIGWANVPTIRNSIAKGDLSLDKSTEGVLWQEDLTVINLRALMKTDLESWQKKFVTATTASQQKLSAPLTT